VSEQIDNRIQDANKKAVERIQISRPVLVDIKSAIEVISRYEKEFNFPCWISYRMETDDRPS
jgi:hypothetical protein